MQKMEGLHKHWRKLALVAIALASCLGGYLVYVRSPFLPPCYFREWTGLYCPGCGMTRASNALLHGNLPAAFGFNPLAIVMLPAVLYGMGHEMVAWAWQRPEWRLRLGSRLSITLALIVIGYGVVRNLPWFDFLRP